MELGTDPLFWSPLKMAGDGGRVTLHLASRFFSSPVSSLLHISIPTFSSLAISSEVSPLMLNRKSGPRLSFPSTSLSFPSEHLKNWTLLLYSCDWSPQLASPSLCHLYERVWV